MTAPHDSLRVNIVYSPEGRLGEAMRVARLASFYALPDAPRLWEMIGTATRYEGRHRNLGIEIVFVRALVVALRLPANAEQLLEAAE